MRPRNPRYAPESLERKLNPSALGLPVPAEIDVVDVARSAARVSPAPVLLDPGDPPVSDPIIPIGPDGPAFQASPLARSVVVADPGDPPVDNPNIPIGPDGPA